MEAALDLVTGELLEAHEFGVWLLVNVGIGVVGTVSMFLFYYLDWQRAPNASSLTAAPDLDIHDKKSIARSFRFAAQQAETKADVSQH